MIRTTSFIYIIFTTLLFSLIDTNAQTPIHSVVSDVVLDKPLSNVLIKNKKSDLISISNNEGYFYFNIDTSSTGLKGYFLIENNKLYSFFNTSFNIYIYDTAGKIHYQEKNVSERNSIILNEFNVGVYFIKLQTFTEDYICRLIVSSQGYYISKSTHQNNNERVYSDTIVFSKDTYFDRTLALSDDRFYNGTGIKLLKKSYDQLDYFTELISNEAFGMIANQPSKTHLNDVESVKLFVDIRGHKVYYINSKKHLFHYDFAKEILNYPYSQNQFNSEQYTDNSKRYLFPATLNYFKELDVYTIEFFSSYGANCEDVYFLYNKILESSFLKDKLYFYATNDSWGKCESIPTITSNELYEGQNYQALNLAKGYGYLRKVITENITTTELSKQDIVLTNGIPIDIPVIAGIITTEFQTPLSHINVLSHNRGTPNMALKNGFSDLNLNSLIDKLVYLKVGVDSFEIKEATLEDATAFWNENEPKDTILLQKDIADYGLINLEKADINDIDKIGGKAANFAEILKAFNRDNITPPVPENYFAIPFYYYQEHIENAGIDILIQEALHQLEFKENSEFRKSKLQEIRNRIQEATLNQTLLENVLTKMKSDPRFISYRFRSSTNAEDLNNFNGAGLYSSYSGKLDGSDKTVDVAIKKVWASLWNFNAFEEREYFKIDHFSIAMGVLVHRSFPDEDANGVAITENIYNRNPGYVINVQFKEISVVDPEPEVIHDQVIVYTFSLNDEKYTLEYNTTSNVIKDTSDHVMSDKELFQLGDYLTIINEYFYTRVYDCKCNYIDFGLDIEFKVDSSLQERKIYIKQARPY